MTGTVTWYNDAKGFGSIAPDDGSPDAYLHFSNVERWPGEREGADNYWQEGDRIEFDVVEDEERRVAVRIRPEGSDPEPGTAAHLIAFLAECDPTARVAFDADGERWVVTGAERYHGSIPRLTVQRLAEADAGG